MGVEPESLLDADLSVLREPAFAELARLLVLWPTTVRMAAERHEPSTLITYLFRLAHLANATYAKLWVLGQPEQVRGARMAAYMAVRQVLRNGLELLALQAVKRYVSAVVESREFPC